MPDGGWVLLAFLLGLAVGPLVAVHVAIAAEQLRVWRARRRHGAGQVAVAALARLLRPAAGPASGGSRHPTGHPPSARRVPLDLTYLLDTE